MQALGVAGVIGVARGTDARSDVQLRVVDGERRLQLLGDPPADRRRHRETVRIRVELGQQHELVSALSGQHIRRAPNPIQTLGELAQQPVTGGVPETVVDQLEVVEIDHQQQHLPRAAGPCQGDLQALREASSIGQTGEWIVKREVRQPRRGLGRVGGGGGHR